MPGGGAVVYQDGAHLASRALAERTVALTFDDGPDPRWTPAVLDALAREHVPATFFVVGTRAAHDPALVRRAIAEGHEVGNHTWSHADLAQQPAWRHNLELSLTQLGLAGSGSVTSALLRPPYSSTPDALTTPELSAVRRETRAGYLVVLSDRDGEDWRRPGVDQVVRNAGPVGTGGAVVLLHDGGGDRAQTVQALPALIRAYRDAGFRFTTVSGGLGLPPTAGDEPVTGLRRAQGVGLLAAVRIADVMVTAVSWLVLPFGLLALLRTLLVMATARRHVRVSTARLEGDEWLPPVSVLVPAYNEAVGIAQSVRSLAASHYPGLEVVVIDDGSTDGTGDIVEQLGLPNVRVVRQVNGGKAAALRTGTREASHDVLVMLDGDTVFEPDTIRALVQPLRNPTVGAVSGNTKVGNRRGLLGRWQHLEYVAGFNLDRRLLDLLQCITTVPGAAGAFRRQAVEQAGGLSTDTLAEDTDITMAILRTGYQVVHEERARAWTEAPSNVTDLWRQRWRWGYGTLQCIWKHRAAVRERSRLGLLGLPYMLFAQVVLPVLAPVIDVFAVHGLLTGSAGKVAGVWLAYLALQLAAGGYALHLDGESLRPLWALPLQQFFYRQLIYLVVVQSVVSAIAGAHLPWHKLERTGEMQVTPA
ncbi:MAG: bifunctional polysaccharide deacetylase/glycosyltransferase family 2 protein [Actinobacteria bacterium]|nr:bifunctional polysaccharide deacetylase/glycosyltransferase family 2 protein [Actinomycetota bacterium]